MTTVIAPFHAISLYCTQSGADKEYHIQIQPTDGALYTVNFQYGRRGSSLTAGTKTPSPVSLEMAKKIYNKLAAEKTAKGYSPGTQGVPFQQTPLEHRDTGLQPQLLNTLDDSDLEDYLGNATHWMQEKKNGRRRRIRKVGHTIIGSNKLGLAIALAEPLIHALRALPLDTVELDGEEIGTTLHCFDLTNADGSYTAAPYDQRYQRLRTLLDTTPQDALQLVPTAFTPEDKRAVFAQLKHDHAEGVVFKDYTAPYTIGRPSSGGPQLKYKFLATGSFIVVAHNTKRSVQIGAMTPSGLHTMNNVTIPPNHAIPAIGRIIEVEYLYAFPATHALCQPVYLEERDDVTREECLLTQLKYLPHQEPYTD